MDRREFLSSSLGVLILPKQISYLNVEDFIKNLVAQTNKINICLTIDDGPRKQMFDILDLLGFAGQNPVIFYCLGQNMNTPHGKEITKLAISLGHTIGNHSYSHPVFSQISFERAKQEIQKTEEVINQLYGEAGVERKEKFFRFPYGAKSQAVSDYLSENNFKIQFWDTDTCDWRYYSKRVPMSLQSIIKNAENARDKDIVLCHDLGITAKYIVPLYVSSGKYKLTLPKG